MTKQKSTKKSTKKITKRELLAKALLTLPKEGKTLEALTKVSGMNIQDVQFLSSFAICLEIVVKKDNKYYKI